MESNKQYAKVTEFDGVPKAGELLPLAFQHVVAMIVGVSVALGSGITQAEGCLQLFPQWFVTIFGGSSVVVTTILSIFLNTILPKESEGEEA